MRTLIVLVIVGLALSCKDSTAPDDPRLESELNFLFFPDSIVSRLPREVSFWAKKGDDREVSLRYDAEGDDDEFLEFDVPGDALLRYPDGTAFEPGDSVRITIRVDAANRFLFTFEPEGLEFDPRNPAELEIEFDVLGGDLNGDGRVDALDAELRQSLDIWRQARPGDPWNRLFGRIRIDADEIEADITSFSGFCIAT